MDPTPNSNPRFISQAKNSRADEYYDLWNTVANAFSGRWAVKFGKEFSNQVLNPIQP